jgi:hypothetical protein
MMHLEPRQADDGASWPYVPGPAARPRSAQPTLSEGFPRTTRTRARISPPSARAHARDFGSSTRTRPFATSTRARAHAKARETEFSESLKGAHGRRSSSQPHPVGFELPKIPCEFRNLRLSAARNAGIPNPPSSSCRPSAQPPRVLSAPKGQPTARQPLSEEFPVASRAYARACAKAAETREREFFAPSRARAREACGNPRPQFRDQVRARTRARPSHFPNPRRKREDRLLAIRSR